MTDVTGTHTVDAVHHGFTATDGYPLSGRIYTADKPRGIIVVASATGVPQGFYKRFATRAATLGYQVVTFDYRGIGESAPNSLRGFDMDYRDWARKDLQGIIDEICHPHLPLFMVGHSYGGHALGLLDNHYKVSAACFFGAGAGWSGWMPRAERVRVTLMWNLIGPVLTRLQGYLGWSVIGMGQDLPLGVYRQWKRWCRFPHYFFDDPQLPDMKLKYAAVKTPILAATAVDDRWAMPRSRDAFMRHYSGSPLSTVDLIPRDLGLKTIGHMGYFRGTASALWQDIFRFFEVHGGSSSGGS